MTNVLLLLELIYLREKKEIIQYQAMIKYQHIFMVEEEDKENTTQEVLLISVLIQRLDSPRVMGVYTMYRGKNLLVREKVPQWS